MHFRLPALDFHKWQLLARLCLHYLPSYTGVCVASTCVGRLISTLFATSISSMVRVCNRMRMRWNSPSALGINGLHFYWSVRLKFVITTNGPLKRHYLIRFVKQGFLYGISVVVYESFCVLVNTLSIFSFEVDSFFIRQWHNTEKIHAWISPVKHRREGKCCFW